MTLRNALARRAKKVAAKLERPSREEELADAYRKGIAAAWDWIEANGCVVARKDVVGVWESVYHHVYQSGDCDCRKN